MSPALFDVLRIPLLRGREFTPADDEHATHVVIVSRRLGEALWPGRTPIGKLLVWPNLSGAPRPPLLVVGEVADTKHASLADAEPPLVMYVPYAQERPTNLSLLVRTRDGTPMSAARIRRIVAGVAPSARVEDPRPLGSVIAMTLEPQRLASMWIGAFGSVALVLAAVGLYGVVAQGVLQRRRELAVRTALGARPRAIARLVIGEGLALGAAAPWRDSRRRYSRCSWCARSSTAWGHSMRARWPWPPRCSRPWCSSRVGFPPGARRVSIR